jgi:hypothetical protein
MNSTTVNNQFAIDDLFARLEAHIKDTEDCYIGNQDTVRAALAAAINTVQQGDTVNRCVECHVDMGQSNPRQYCAKTHCSNAPLDDY